MIKKRGFVIGALVLVLAAAVYLNWQFAPSESYIAPDESAAAENELGDAMLVSAQAVMTDSKSPTDAVTASTEEEYFTDAYAQREKARKESLAILEEVINDASKNGADKSDAVSRTAVIAQQIQYENNIESLVKAKGFKDCVAIVSETQVNVIVPKSAELTASQISVITDIVIAQTNLPASCINIVQPKIN